jgi:hypothetical protein
MNHFSNFEGYFGDTDDMQNRNIVNEELDEFDKRMETKKRLNHYYPNKNTKEWNAK